MLHQILKNMFIEPELLAELDEEQKQLLFCKMREEQVRKWKMAEMAYENDASTVPKKPSEGGKKVSFKMGLDGEPVVSVIGSVPDEVETMLEEKAKHQAELEDGALRLAAEEELDKLVNLSHSAVQEMEVASTKPVQKMDPTREAVVKSLQEAKQEMDEMEEKMRSETEIHTPPDVPTTQQKSKEKNVHPAPPSQSINVGVPLSQKNGNKAEIAIDQYSAKGDVSSADDIVPLLNTSTGSIAAAVKPQPVEPNRVKLKNPVCTAGETHVPVAAPLYITSKTPASASSSSVSSMFTLQNLVINPISDFPLRKQTSDELASGVAAHVKQYECLSNSSIAALKTATLERAKKRRTKEILEYLRQQVHLAKRKDPEDVAWRKQECKAKDAEKRIREIARRAREQHRLVASGSGEQTSRINGSPCKLNTMDKSHHQEDINGNMKDENLVTQRKADPLRNVSGKPEILAKPSTPPSRKSIIDWFRLQELPKGAGLDAERHHIAKWFHGIISRNEAEEILLKGEVGSYLVRVSERIWGYVVSYRSSEKCRHYLIDITDGNYAFLGSYKNTHSSLGDLIEYHRTNAITTTGDECELLLKPCSQLPSKKVYEELFFGTAYKVIHN